MVCSKCVAIVKDIIKGRAKIPLFISHLVFQERETFYLFVVCDLQIRKIKLEENINPALKVCFHVIYKAL